MCIYLNFFINFIIYLKSDLTQLLVKTIMTKHTICFNDCFIEPDVIFLEVISKKNFDLCKSVTKVLIHFEFNCIKTSESCFEMIKTFNYLPTTLNLCKPVTKVLIHFKFYCIKTSESCFEMIKTYIYLPTAIVMCIYLNFFINFELQCGELFPVNFF